MAASPTPTWMGGCVATVGSCDGVHRGHRAVIATVVRRARATGVRSVLVTFDPHPLSVLRPEMAPGLLTTMAEKKEALASTELDVAHFLRFSRRLSRYPPERFVREILVGRLGVRELIVGHDHGFGRDRAGDAGTLEELGASLGFNVEVVPPLATGRGRDGDGDAVSSTRIRGAVAKGNLREAERCLGRPYSISGRVMKGDGRGHSLGFPTANLELFPEKLLPPPGIYAVRVFVPSGEFIGASHIGPRPTFPGAEPSVEVHLLDYLGGDLYGKRIRMDLVEFIRGVEYFEDLPSLAGQMEEDVEVARAVVGLAGRKYRKSRQEVT